ncbi:MAG: lantibiotic dehydratase family protein, partial [Allomuricauda sp.]
MNYLVALSQNLAQNETIREQLLFFPNSSIYTAGNQVRYVEYKYVDGKRNHHIIAVDNTPYLQKVLCEAKKGAKLSQLAALLVNEEIGEEEALEYVEELASNQLLISELEPAVSGPEFLEQIKSVLKKLDNVNETLDSLDKIDLKIQTIDHAIGNDPKDYFQLKEFIQTLQTDFDPKYLFQTDLVVEHGKNTIDESIIQSIKKGLALLNRISSSSQETTLSKFKDAFYERYESREVNLSKALDVEMGLGYRQNQDTGDLNPLIDGIKIDQRQNGPFSQDIKWTSIDSLFQKKLIEANRESAYTIQLNDDDFNDFEINWDDLPDTLSCMVEMVLDNGKEKIKFNGGGGSSASNLLGRFCHGDEDLHQHTKEIIAVETQMNKDKILAEIVHLPESRVGNILMRPCFRDYEIPYLAKSVRPIEFQLPLDDLMVSVKNNKGIVLRSKNNNKEVIPHLTNAHNYVHNSLPIYNFLADIQMQGIRSGLRFDLGSAAMGYKFIPRIEYHNLIFQEATWNLEKSEIEPLLNHKNSDNELWTEAQKFRKRFQIPQYAKLADGDNELLVNFNNLTSVKMLLDAVSKRTSFKITEFLFVDDGVVKQGQEYYTNQVIVSFFNERKLTDSKQVKDE